LERLQECSVCGYERPRHDVQPPYQRKPAPNGWHPAVTALAAHYARTACAFMTCELRVLDALARAGRSLRACELGYDYYALARLDERGLVEQVYNRRWAVRWPHWLRGPVVPGWSG